MEFFDSTWIYWISRPYTMPGQFTKSEVTELLQGVKRPENYFIEGRDEYPDYTQGMHCNGQEWLDEIRDEGES